MKYISIKKLFVFGFLYFISSFAVAQTISVPTLPAGKSIIVLSSVKVDNPFNLVPSQVSKQHTISGINFLNVVSNDPKTLAAGDPTLTLISLFPTVTSINRFDPLTENTNVASVIFRVTFSASVSGVDVSDFFLTTTGTATGTISAVAATVVPGTVYDVTVNAITGDGTIRLDLNNSGTNIVDEGNVPLEGGFITGQTYTIDQTVPTLSPVTITSNNTNTAYAKVGDIITLSFTSSETITLPTATINSIPEVASPVGNVNTVQHTMTAGETEGLVAFSISGYADPFGNAGVTVSGTTNSSSVTFDKTLPSVTSINRFNPSSSLTNLSSVVYRVSFSEPVSGVDISDFALTNTGSVNGSIASVSASSGTVIDVTVNSITGVGTLRLDLNSSGTGITDVASNSVAGGFTTGQTYSVDGTAPSVFSINRNTLFGALTNATTVAFRVTFSEAVSGFDADDLVLNKTGTVNGIIATILVVDGSTYDVIINSLTGDGDIRLDLKNSGTGITDAATNPISVGFNSGETYTIDHTPPVLSPVTIASNNSNTTYAKVGNQVAVSFTASETITTPTVTIAGHSIVVPAPSGLVYSPNYTITSGDAEGVIPFNVTGYTDLAGNAGVAVNTTTNGSSVTFDKTVPVVTSINRFNPSASLTNLSSVVYRVTFSEAVSGVDVSDFALTNTGTAAGSIASVSASSGTVIDVTVNSITGTGTLRLDLNSSGAGISDVAGNALSGGFTTDETYSVDRTVPTVTSINRNTPSSALTNATSVVFRITFSEPVSGTDPTDFTLNKTGTVNGTIAAVSAIDGSTYDVTVNTITGDGTIRLDLKGSGTGITDVATNAISGGDNTGQVYTIDHTPPVLSPVTIASNNSNPVYAKVGNQVTVNFTASETITTPTVTIAGHSIVVPVPSGLVYSPNYTMTSGDAEGVVGFNVSGYADLAGNAGVAVTATTNSSSVTFDKTSPAVTSINRLTPSTAQTVPTNLSYRVTFSEAVSGVDISDFVLTKTSSADGTILSVSASSGSVIDVTVNNVTGTGTMRLDLKNTGTGIIDVASNAISGGFTAGQIYTIGVPPAFTLCPANVTADIDPNQCTKTLVLNATATGSPTPTLTSRVGGAVITSPYAFPIGTTQVVVTASNGMLPDATCTYIVTVHDHTAPTLSVVTANPVALWPPDHSMKDVALTYTSADNCGTVTNVVTVTSNEAIHGTSDGDKGPDWEIVNDHLIKLRAERGNGKEARVYTITVTSTDLSGNTSVSSTEVRVAHNIVSPASGAYYIVGSTVNFSGVFWDKPGNKHTAQWLIDDNTIAKATVTEPSGTKNGKVAGSYKFTAPGVYKLQMNVMDQNKVTSYANTNDDLEAIVVIYDPNGGYTYGGGWFNSPGGALKADATATGKASFGFSMNYFKNATNPKGESQFEFKVGDFEYNALNFDYLSISGARAQFRGTGKITGGQSGIAFIMTVIDGALNGTGVDKVRMKIYNKLTNQVYFDTQMGESDANDPKTIVGENSNVVIGGTNGTSSSVRMYVETETPAPELNAVVLPNPSTKYFTVNISNHTIKQALDVEVYDQYGRLVEERNVFGSTVNLGENYRPGVYYLKIKQGKSQKEIKLIKL